MSTNIVPILVPTGELSDSFVVGMLRLFQSTNNHFVGDLLARHAPKSTDFYSRVIRANAPMVREQPRIERCYMFEMLGFTKGLMQALMDESIGMSTAWGRTQPQLGNAVNTYMERNSQNWECDGTGSREQREFYDEVMDPFLHRVNGYWDVKIRKHPNLMWFGTLTRDGDLIIEAGEDYRVADPESLIKKKEASGFLDESYGEAIGECNSSYLRFRRHIDAIEREFNIVPVEDPKLRARQIEAAAEVMAKRIMERRKQEKVFFPEWEGPEEPARFQYRPVNQGIIAVMPAKDDVVDDSSRPDPTKSSVPEVPGSLAEVIARNPLAIIRAQNILTNHEAEQRLKRENPLNLVSEMMVDRLAKNVGRAGRKFAMPRDQKKPDTKSES